MITKGDYDVMDTVEISFEKDGKYIYLDIDGIDPYLNGGEIKGLLDKKTKDQFKGVKSGTRFIDDVLRIRSGSKIMGEMCDRGFYHYNPGRLLADSILTVRVKKIIKKTKKKK